MIKTKKLGLLVFCVLCIFLIPLLFSGCGETPKIVNDGYSLKNYTVVADITGDGKIKIHEKFQANFNKSNLHGIFRYIPTYLTAYYDKKGKVVKKDYRVSIVDADAVHTRGVFKDSDETNYIFRFGRENSYMQTGVDYDYEISYTMIMPDDRLIDMDVFYYNILPTNWDVAIQNVNFVVNYLFDMPKDVLKDKTKIYTGVAGDNQELAGVEFFDNKIVGHADSLKPFNGITVYTELNDGQMGSNTNKYILYAVGGLFAIICIVVILFFYYRKKKIDRDLIPTVEFVAPDDLTPAECGLILDGKVDNRDLVSMIVYWASRGNIKIIQDKKEIYLEKLKALDEKAKSFEFTIFDCIFAGGDKVNIDNIDAFGDTLVLAKAQLKKDIKHLNYEPTTKTARRNLQFWASLIPAIFSALMVSLTCKVWLGSPFIAMIITFLGTYFVVHSATYLYNYACDKKLFNKGWLTTLYKCIAYGILLVLCILTMIMTFEMYVDKFFLLIWSYLFSMVAMYWSGNVLSRTQKSNDRLGKIVGLKNFILVAEKDKLEMLAKENPNSFYEILPYAYVLNVTDVYCEKFDGIKLTTPDWYVSDQLIDNTFSSIYFLHLFNVSMNQTYSTLLSAYGSSKISTFAQTVSDVAGGSGSGGGVSGGGFSGGGFGGGGGSSW